MWRSLGDKLDTMGIDAVVSVDGGTLGCLGNHARLHGLLSDQPGWSVILEDDALPINDFSCDLAYLLDRSPTQIVSLYLGTGYPSNWQPRIKKALEADTTWIIGPSLLHAVGYAISPDIKLLVANYLASGPRMEAPDAAISHWARGHGVDISYTNPSLVDHRDTEPAVKHRPGNFSSRRNRPRHAHNTRQRLTWTDNSVIMSR